MLLHPLFKTLATEPQMLLDHAAGYAQLASAESRQWLAQEKHRLAAVLAGAALLLIGITLAGGALLVLAAVPVDRLNAPWLLAVVPATPILLGAALTVWALQRPRLSPFPLTREQWALDRGLLDSAAQAHGEAA